MRKTKTCNYICAVLALVFLILHFIPFWEYDGVQTSIQGYIWFPSSHPELAAYFAENVIDFAINAVVGTPILLLFTAAASLIVCIWKSDTPLAAILPGACGVIGLWGYLTSPILQLGTNRWVHMTVCAAMVVVAVITLAAPLKDAVKKWREKK